MSEVPIFFRDAGSPVLRMGTGGPPRKTLLPHTCNHTKFRRSKSNRMGVDRGSEKIFRDAGPSHLWMGARLILINTLLSPLCYRAKFSLSRSNHTNVINGKLPVKFNHLILTQIDRLPMTSYYWSIVTMDLSSTVFTINGDFCRLPPVSWLH